jgi:hypothetical protein
MGGMLTEAEALVFDASDQMPTSMNAAFWSNMVSLTAGQQTVAEALERLQGVAVDAYAQ